ncbi:MotA/TolQ/ExbB proton channel family protein [Acetatifactor aquisgranensis]|uniref:MotA/TolQ/ExbB proton channel family protein n=1 Tax=Acetatifactor aquisgranensis TaxID=2941233 RepID=UPI002040A21A|nr:MotA/TolQ/ExbB proton channel family protein [Acetatifactor aquisgranensis]
MKSRLFYGLFIVYAAMVAFVLSINGVFTGEIESVSNLVINGAFLGIIGILFVMSAASFMRLNRLTDELEDAAGDLKEAYKKAGNQNVWNELEKDKDFFEEENLKKAFDRFLQQMRSSRVGKRYASSCNIEDYINEELLDRVGSSHFNSAISGTMTGLGILGTFIGLSLGLGSFSGDDIYTISDNVGPLLSGMKVAFHTSVYGIIFSLIFNFIYRSIMADAYGKLEYFLGAFRQCAAPPVSTGDENTAAMLVYQANQANYMKELLELAKGEAKEQTQALEQMARSFVEQLQSVMGTELKNLGAALEQASQTQVSGAENNKALLEAVSDLAESNRHMQENMAHMLKQQEQLAEDLAKQRRELESVCKEISQDVSSQLYTFQQMRTLYEDKK